MSNADTRNSSDTFHVRVIPTLVVEWAKSRAHCPASTPFLHFFLAGRPAGIAQFSAAFTFVIATAAIIPKLADHVGWTSTCWSPRFERGGEIWQKESNAAVS
jgi:hypothetical protein